MMDNVAKDLNPTARELAATERLSKFDGAKIRQELKKQVKLSELPAVGILASQIDKSQADILKKVPNAQHQQVALSLAGRFFRRSLYQRISEQAMFGPEDYERSDDPNALAPLLPAIKNGIAVAEQAIRTNRPSAKIIRENGWLFVDQDKLKTDYRIYLSPDSTQIGKVFSDLALTIPESLRYQMKTFDNRDHALEVSRLDKIILYCSEEDFDEILTALNKVYQQNKGSFRNRPAPGGGTISPAEGVSITKQPDKTANGRKLTGTEQIANAIDEALNQLLPEITKNRLGKFKDTTSANQSDEAELLWSVMQLDQEYASNLWYAGKDPLSDAQKNALETAYSQPLYGVILYNCTEGRPISAQQIRQRFLKSLEGHTQLTSSQRQYLVAEKMSEFQDQSVRNNVANVFKKTGLTIAFDDALIRRETPGVAFKRIFI